MHIGKAGELCFIGLRIFCPNVQQVGWRGRSRYVALHEVTCGWLHGVQNAPR